MPISDDLRDALIREVLYRIYDECLPRILQCLDELDDEGIWWRPNENSNSIGNLVLHLNGNVRQWIITGLGKGADVRHRQAEFDARRVIQREELVSLFLMTMAHVRPIISNTPVEELLNIRAVQTFEETGLTILIHVTEHFSYHTGQIAYITKMLTDRQLGFYKGIPLE
ncbi:MAG: DinB family protein [Saprospiraceae bacterium]